jgi:hypothetical protein
LPLESYLGSGQRPLWELRVTGFGGFVDARSGVEVAYGCEECAVYSFRIKSSFAKLVDIRKWDGSDIFTIWPFPSIRICTDRVVKVVASNQLRGVATIPIEEFGDVEDIPISPGIPSATLSEHAVATLLNDVDFVETILDARPPRS